jgi:hypothetical protein
VTYTGLPFLIPESTLNFALGYEPRVGLGFYGLQVHTATGQDLGQGGSGSPISNFGTWYRFRLSYSRTLEEVRLTVTDRETSEIRLSLTRPATGINLFSPGMQFLGIANHPTGYHPGLIWALTPDGYLDTEIDNVVLTYEPAPVYTPTLTLSPIIVPFGGSATLSWNTGGAPVSACTLTQGSIPLSLTGTTGSVTIPNVQGRIAFTLTCGGTTVTRILEVIPTTGGT